MNRRDFLKCAGVCAAALAVPGWANRALAQAAGISDVKPNFIVIFIDDMGYGDIEPYGSKVNRTPNLSRMAKEGMKLTSFYAAPVCTPSRAQMMTGCYAKRVSMPNVIFPRCPNGLSTEEKTVARYPDSGILASGWLLGEPVIARRSALVDAKAGSGHIILFGMRPQYRAQSYLTFKLFFKYLFVLYHILEVNDVRFPAGFFESPGKLFLGINAVTC